MWYTDNAPHQRGPHPDHQTLVNMLTSTVGRKDFADMFTFMILRWEIILDYVSRTNVLKKERRRQENQSQRHRGQSDAIAGWGP